MLNTNNIVLLAPYGSMGFKVLATKVGAAGEGKMAPPPPGPPGPPPPPGPGI